MKKFLILCFTFIMGFCLAACSGSGGNVQNVKTHEVDSALYSKKEIKMCIRDRCMGGIPGGGNG